MSNEKSLLTPSITDAISSYFSIGPLIHEPRVVSIDKINQVWEIETKKGRFALKRVSTKRLYEETEKIARYFQQAKLPVITALKGIYQHGPYYFQLFEWVEGKVMSVDEILPQQAEKIGSLLFNFHQMNLTPSQFDLTILNDLFYDYPFNKAEWVRAVDMACALKINSSDKLQSLLPELIAVSEESREATARLKPSRLISHRDIGPQNVIWNSDDDPVIIDWELAGLIPPTVEVLGIAFDWSVVRHDKIDDSRYNALLQGYQQAGGSMSQVPLAFAALMGTWLSWLLVNLQRFIAGKCPDRAEKEVIQTLLTFEEVYCKGRYLGG
ncbi:aminoglycoside phosphotransferase family protein [Coxiella burnetii]|uniref:aminoglycoside phosphotransferase family protein n=1 Tax=Coxiella burnetii TaxID=777 RepID=UPI0000ECFF92|nr:aminoglycoside phosphotransferase family protein [Coxiella burnetii]ACJ20026.1 hypothetical membrane-associated protein [Coxiella burnetii CbuK_Q154]AIT63056.1 putative membrane-associated protein [Coxiella burnetii str. Namibia]ATN85477.1 hypothetical protein AYO29_02670 [Coxiella burnetii str. Schperling]EAX33831.1 hypothetical protein A35_03860 [Coxiella burnetii 'MSU Goat Q177']EDR36361.1 hypothetical protein COXBURSA334_0909 [Coxiella burnetii Q321]